MSAPIERPQYPPARGPARASHLTLNDALMMTMGLVMLGAVLTNDSSVTLTDVTPVARLTGESEIVVVPADSPYESMEDFVAEWG